MRYYRKAVLDSRRIVVADAVAFEDLVAHGRAVGGNIVNGMPWSFLWHDLPVTHENDECYLVTTADGTLRVTPDDMLVLDEKSSWDVQPSAFVITRATFDAGYAPEHPHA